MLGLYFITSIANMFLLWWQWTCVNFVQFSILMIRKICLLPCTQSKCTRNRCYWFAAQISTLYSRLECWLLTLPLHNSTAVMLPSRGADVFSETHHRWSVGRNEPAISLLQVILMQSHSLVFYFLRYLILTMIALRHHSI